MNEDDTNQDRDDEKLYLQVSIYENNEQIGGKLLPENEDIARFQNYHQWTTHIPEQIIIICI